MDIYTFSPRALLALAFLVGGVLVLSACGRRPFEPGPGSRPEPAVETCLARSCHRAERVGQSVHAPVKDGPCTACHRQKNKDHPGEEGREFEPLLMANNRYCFSCHPGSDPGAFPLHKPYAAGRCLRCHMPHSSDIPPLLKRDVNGLCLYCHQDIRQRLESVRFRHHAFDEVSCVSLCHDPHGSDWPKLLQNEAARICLQCHVPAGGRGKCPPDTDNRCVLCHYPHGGNRRDMLRG